MFMKNLRYLITVLAIVNAGLVAQAAAASPNIKRHSHTLNSSITTVYAVAIGTHGND